MPTKSIESALLPAPDSATRKSKSSPIRRVGVAGLGIMGSAMAGNLMQAGFEVFGFDPGAQARKRFRNAAGQLCKDLGAMVPSVQVLICSLPTSEALLATAQQLAALAPRGMLVIETSTLDINGKQQARKLLASAGIAAAEVDAINAHGTGTQANDVAETAAIKRVFGTRAGRIPISATKALHGHLLGAAGALEFVLSLLALQQGVALPTMHLDVPDPGCDLDYVAHVARVGAAGRTMLSNSFAFGGTNAVLAMRAVA